VLNWYLPFLLLSLTPWIGSAGALGMGLVLSLGFAVPLPAAYKHVAKWLLQSSIVLMGFSMQPAAVARAGVEGVGMTAAGLVLALGVGLALAKAFRVPSRMGTLIAVGTAICGGSAIAAVAPVIEAESDEIAVSLACVFLLNAVALLVFPSLGHLLGMTPEAFGRFAAIAIHDTSSVVGAATRFADASVPIAVTIKLTRALWILPVSVGFALLVRARKPGKKAKVSVPWFILAFAAAVIFRALVPGPVVVYDAFGMAGKAGLNGAIFLISAQMSRKALARVGWRPLAMGVSLWAFVIAACALALRAGWV